MRGSAIAVMCALLVGCGPTAGGSTDAAETTTTDASTSTGTTAAATPTPDMATPDLPDEPVDPTAACAALCATRWACAGEPVDPQCVNTCVAGLGHGAGLEAECLAADATLTACLATLECEVLADHGGYRACDPELRAMLTACQLCHGLAGWVDQDTCFADDLCPDGLLRIECDADTCVCTLEGAFTRTCPGGCDPDGLPTHGLGCCRG